MTIMFSLLQSHFYGFGELALGVRDKKPFEWKKIKRRFFTKRIVSLSTFERDVKRDCLKWKNFFFSFFGGGRKRIFGSLPKME